MGRLMALGHARNRYMEEQQRKMEAAAKKAEAERIAAEQEGGRNWLNLAGTGASMGAAAGPWGALIGAGVGAVAGIAGSTASRMREGKGFGSALGNAFIHPVGDKWDGMQDIPLGGMVAGLTQGAKAAGLGQSTPAPALGPKPAAAVTESEFLAQQDPELAMDFYGGPNVGYQTAGGSSYDLAAQNRVNSIYGNPKGSSYR